MMVRVVTLAALALSTSTSPAPAKSYKWNCIYTQRASSEGLVKEGNFKLELQTQGQCLLRAHHRKDRGRRHSGCRGMAGGDWTEARVAVVSARGAGRGLVIIPRNF
jgi:hypothetical protein